MQALAAESSDYAGEFRCFLKTLAVSAYEMQVEYEDPRSMSHPSRNGPRTVTVYAGQPA
jgi:hypothetical protein